MAENSNGVTEEFAKKLTEDMSPDEIKKLTDALQKEEFKKLFLEYCEEIRDPENRKRYEDEITQLENERGMNVEFIHPVPGYVIKTVQNGSQKIFVNICSNEKISQASCEKQMKDGKSGLSWSIPHSFSPPREDLDHEKKLCLVYDVVFHPDTLRMASRNKRFNQIVEDTALQGIERSFKVSLDKSNTRKPKTMKYKGTPTATALKSKREDYDEKQAEIKNNPNPFIQYPEADGKSSEAEEKQKHFDIVDSDNSHCIPEYSVKYSYDSDISDYALNPYSKVANTSKPKKIIYSVHLPLLKSARSIDMDIAEKELSLVSEKPAAYKLHVDLSYAVDSTSSTAKFDRSSRMLTIVLPIKAVDTIVEENNVFEKLREENPSLSSNPLITVLSETDGEMNNVDIEKPESEIVCDNETEETETESSTTAAGIVTTMPSFDYYQSSKYFVIKLQTKYIQSESVVVSETPENCFNIRYSSRGAGGWISHFAINFKFVDGLSKPNVDISDLDCVAVFEKHVPEFFSEFYYSDDVPNWQTLSLTDNRSDIFSRFSALDDEMKDGNTDKLKGISVTEMHPNIVRLSLYQEVNEDEHSPEAAVADAVAQAEAELQALTINSTCNTKLNSSPTDTLQFEFADSHPGLGDDAEDVEVVFSHTSRAGLHGILKHHRTVSETSSDDLASSLGSSAGARNICRSVSFSEKDEVTNYQVNATVSALHHTLRNKAKKKRKRENQRRRHSSCGDSEDGSSGGSLGMNVDSSAGIAAAAGDRQRHHSDSSAASPARSLSSSSEGSSSVPTSPDSGMTGKECLQQTLLEQVSSQAATGGADEESNSTKIDKLKGPKVQLLNTDVFVLDCD